MTNITKRLNLQLLANLRLIRLIQPERLFLALAIPFGLVFLFLSPPFQAPDEYVHFYRAYAVSTGQLTGTQVTIPKSVYDFSVTVSKDLAGNDQNKQSKKALAAEFSRTFEEQPQAEVSILNSAIISPLPYLPQALGVLIGRLAHLHPIFIFYLGRLVNFLAWIGLLLLAIRTTPVHPRLFAALALMPMTLQQAASNSPDAATIAISFLFVAYALRMLMQEQAGFRWTDWARISMLMVALALCKSVYILAAGLLALVFFRRFRLQRAVAPLTLAVIGLGLASGFAWLRYSSSFVSEAMMTALHTPTTAGIGYILQNPQIAVPILWSSAVTHIGYQLSTFIGVLGWIDTVLPVWVYPVYYALLFFIVIFETHPLSYFSIGERFWIAFMAGATSLVMAAIFFYPGETSAAVNVDIPQGRYFIPLGMLYFLPFSQRKWSISNESPAWGFIALVHILVLLAAIRAMLLRYYAI